MVDLTQVSEPAVVDEIEVEKQPLTFFTREPILTMAFVQAALACAMGWGFDMTTEQMGLVMSLVAAGLALYTRQQVTPFVSAGTTPRVDNPAQTPQVTATK